MDAGADDYLVKPFATVEVVARTKALLRRPGGALGLTLQAGNIVLDTIGRDVKVGDVSLQLPRRECAVLEHLLRRQGRVVPKTVLEEKLYGIDDELELECGACPRSSFAAQAAGCASDGTNSYRPGHWIFADRN